MFFVVVVGCYYVLSIVDSRRYTSEHPVYHTLNTRDFHGFWSKLRCNDVMFFSEICRCMSATYLSVCHHYIPADVLKMVRGTHCPAICGLGNPHGERGSQKTSSFNKSGPCDIQPVSRRSVTTRVASYITLSHSSLNVSQRDSIISIRDNK